MQGIAVKELTVILSQCSMNKQQFMMKYRLIATIIL